MSIAVAVIMKRHRDKKKEKPILSPKRKALSKSSFEVRQKALLEHKDKVRFTCINHPEHTVSIGIMSTWRADAESIKETYDILIFSILFWNQELMDRVLKAVLICFHDVFSLLNSESFFSEVFCVFFWILTSNVDPRNCEMTEKVHHSRYIWFLVPLLYVDILGHDLLTAWRELNQVTTIQKISEVLPEIFILGETHSDSWKRGLQGDYLSSQSELFFWFRPKQCVVCLCCLVRKLCLLTKLRGTFVHCSFQARWPMTSQTRIIGFVMERIGQVKWNQIFDMTVHPCVTYSTCSTALNLNVVSMELSVRWKCPRWI